MVVLDPREQRFTVRRAPRVAHQVLDLPGVLGGRLFQDCLAATRDEDLRTARLEKLLDEAKADAGPAPVKGCVSIPPGICGCSST